MRLYAALLGHFDPSLWDAAIDGALQQATAIGGGPDALAREATGKRGRAALAEYREALVAARRAVEAGEPKLALTQAGLARQAATRVLALSQTSREGEFRAVWIHSPFGVSDWGWDRSMEELAAAGFNAIIPNMLDAGQSSYPSDYLPSHPRVAEAGDQMAALVAAARKHGIEVHAWKVNYNLSTAPANFVERMRQEGRLQAGQDGEEMPWLCPSHPENRRLEAESMLEVVRNYDVDGIHFDYIRYPGAQSCYDDGCRLRFQAQTGHQVENWPRDVVTGELTTPFQKWRQEQVTALVREVAVRSRDIRPEVELSAAVFSNWPESRYTVGQDWVLWAKEGYLDFVCPMDYIPDVGEHAAMVKRQVDWVDGRIPLYAGIGAWDMSSVEDILTEVAGTRRLGADGFVLFEYSADLAERVLPMLHAGLTKQETYAAHQGPHVEFRINGEAVLDEGSGIRLYPAGQSVAVDVQLVSRTAVPRAKGRLVLERVDGGDALGEALDVRTKMRAESVSYLIAGAGDWRPAVYGDYWDERGKKHPFVRRGPILRVRSRSQIDSLARQFAPPQIEGPGVAMGVFADGHGAGSIHAALSEMDDVIAFQARKLTDELLAQTDVLVIPQPYNRWTFSSQDRARLREWVRAGGGLLVTHDMVGMRGAMPIIPEICARGTGFPSATGFQIVAEHPAVIGIPTGLQPHSYYDHITLEAGPAGEVLAEGEDGEPVLIVGDFGAGRYAALGLIPGLGPDDGEVPLTGAEGQLVEGLVEWLSEKAAQ